VGEKNVNLINDVLSFFQFSYRDLASVDLSNPASWLLVAEMIALIMAGWYLGTALVPYSYRIDAKIDEWADKLLERLGINLHDE
jgi:hypothetical protein